MTAPLIHGGNVNAIMSQFDMYRNSSTMGSPYIQGGYTNLLELIELPHHSRLLRN
jgi:hypothetical protein